MGNESDQRPDLFPRRLPGRVLHSLGSGIGDAQLGEGYEGVAVMINHQRKGFPILRAWYYSSRREVPKFVDWSVLSIEQAQINHGQTLERLAERGGLAPDEIVANIERRRWRPMDIDAALSAIKEHTFGVERAEGGR